MARFATKDKVVGAKLASRRLAALRFPNDVIRDVSRLVQLHLRFHGYGDGEWTDSAVRRYVRDAGPLLTRLHVLTRADCTTRNQAKAQRLTRAYDGLEQRIAELGKQEELARIRPELNGHDIMRILGEARRVDNRAAGGQPVSSRRASGPPGRPHLGSPGTGQEQADQSGANGRAGRAVRRSATELLSSTSTLAEAGAEAAGGLWHLRFERIGPVRGLCGLGGKLAPPPVVLREAVPIG